jgi:ankyrin repeat protein
MAELRGKNSKEFNVYDYLIYLSGLDKSEFVSELGKSKKKREKWLGIHDACFDGKKNIVKELISEKNLKASYRGMTIMHIACFKGHAEIVQELMDKVNLNTSGFYGMTPIHFACFFGHMDIVQMLLDKVNLKALDGNGLMPIHLAGMGNHQEIFRLLLNYVDCHDRNFQNKLEEYHIPHNQQEILKFVLSKMDFESIDNEEDKFRIACMLNKADIVESMIHSMNLKEKDRNNWLHLACLWGSLETVKVLYRYVTTKKKDEEGKSLLHTACISGNVELVQYLLSENFNPNELDNMKSIPIFYACGQGHVEIVKLLLDKSNLEHVSKGGLKLIHVACFANNVEMVKLLLDKVDLEARVDNSTPLYIACMLNNFEMVKLLVNGSIDDELQSKSIKPKVKLDYILDGIKDLDVSDKIIEYLAGKIESCC